MAVIGATCGHSALRTRNTLGQLVVPKWNTSLEKFLNWEIVLGASSKRLVIPNERLLRLRFVLSANFWARL